jgi:hypothetical protein
MKGTLDASEIAEIICEIARKGKDADTPAAAAASQPDPEPRPPADEAEGLGAATETDAAAATAVDAATAEETCTEEERIEADRVDWLLCQEIELRLAALRDRICTAGQAKLPHSRAVMGPPFVPALDFLRDAVCSLAAAAPSQVKRRRHATL